MAGWTAAVAAAAIGAALAAPSGSHEHPVPRARLGALADLAGEWEGTNSEGQAARLTYEIVSDGTALVETLRVGEEETMVTVYHQDGEGLMLTHYCAAGNQPRMRSEKPMREGGVRFAFVDSTNLESPSAGHMRALALTLKGRDRLRQEWTWREKGQERTEAFEFARRR
jgi:hypothetical protein